MTALSILAPVAGVYLLLDRQRIMRRTEARENSLNHRMFELAILKELGDRIGYSLNVEKIVDVITGSLHQFIKYSAVSYMLIGPEKIIFKSHLEKSVHRKFVDDVKERMLKSLSALLDREYKLAQVEETLSGAILIENVEEPVRSFFNIPLVIGEKVVGVLTVAHTDAGLYKEEEMTILYKITAQASQAVTRLEEVVKTEEQKLNAMVESLTDGVVMTDKDYRIVVANPAVTKALHLAKKDPSIFDFIDHLEGKFDIRGKLEESVKLDKVLEIAEVLIGERFFQIFVSPVKNNYGIARDDILGGVVIFHDITKEKELEKLRTDFTSMMVHELRSPLDGIRKMAEFVLSKKNNIKPETFISEYTPIIYKSSSDMLDLVSSLLDASKMEAGKFEVAKEPADIRKVVDDRMRFYETGAKSSGIDFKSMVSPDVPEKILLDSQNINSVFNNLISNALKFTKPQGKVAVQIFVHHKDAKVLDEAKKDGVEWLIKKEDNFSSLPDSVVFAITDSGSGIQAEDMANLFNKFRQFRASVIHGKGTGLGLVIAKGIVEAHKGTIGVASEEGVGSTFYFTIPL